MSYEVYKKLALDLGAHRVAYLDGASIELGEGLCKRFGRCHLCPTDVSNLDEMTVKVRGYKHAMLYKNSYELDCSYESDYDGDGMMCSDYEGMGEAQDQHNRFAKSLEQALRERGLREHLHLSDTGCWACLSCFKEKGEPCGHPAWELPTSLCYGVSMYRSVLKTELDNDGRDSLSYANHYGIVLWNER